MSHDTRKFSILTGKDTDALEILESVYGSLKENGYSPVSQLTGYLLSGDPTYITSYHHARSLIQKIDRYEQLEFLIDSYFNR